MLKRFIGWLADFYPDTVFYADRFMPDLQLDVDDEKPHSSQGSTALIAVAVAAGRLIAKPGGTLTSEFTGVTSGGKNVGDFRITVERLK